MDIKVTNWEQQCFAKRGSPTFKDSQLLDGVNIAYISCPNLMFQDMKHIYDGAHMIKE